MEAFTASSSTVSSSIQELKSPTQRCNICNEILGALRSDGQIETASILPCSHVFGNLCISRWLETDSQHQDCPNCRRRMVYRECGHIIKPCDVSHAPKCVGEKEMPEKCLACRGGGRWEQELRMQNERRLAEENALLGMKMHLPSVFGGMYRDTVDSVDWRIAEMRSYFKKEIDGMFGSVHNFGESKVRDQW